MIKSKHDLLENIDRDIRNNENLLDMMETHGKVVIII